MNKKPKGLPLGFFIYDKHMPLKLNSKPVITLEIYIMCLIFLALGSINEKACYKKSGKAYLSSMTGKIQLDYQPVIPMSDQLWKYLRKGLNFLETGGKNEPSSFVHPGGKAYGSLGLTHAAIKDVLNNCMTLSMFKNADVLTQHEIYEKFAKAYADLLLRHYLKINYWDMPAKEVFDILQNAWFLGPGLYKNGSKTLPSREQKADQYASSLSL